MEQFKLNVPEGLDIFKTQRQTMLPMPSLPSAINVFPLPPKEIIGSAVVIPPTPDLEQFLRHIPEKRPVPPLSEPEKRLRELFSQPDFIRDLVLGLHFTPQQTGTLLSFILQNYPRALPSLDIQYQRQWEEAEEERLERAKEWAWRRYENARQLWLRQVNEILDQEQSHYQTAEKTIQGSLDIPSIIETLVSVSPHVSPQRFDMLKATALSQIAVLVSALPKSQAQEYLDVLERQGWITPVQRMGLENQIGQGEVVRQANIFRLNAAYNQLSRLRDVFMSLGDIAKANEIGDTAQQLDAFRNILSNVGMVDKSVVDGVNRALEAYINKSGAYAQSAVNQLATHTQRLVDGLRQLVPRLWSAPQQGISRMISQIFSGVPAALRRPVVEIEMGRFASGIDYRLATVRALKQTLENIKSMWENLSEVVPLQQMYAGELDDLVSYLNEMERIFKQEHADVATQEKVISRLIERLKDIQSIPELRALSEQRQRAILGLREMALKSLEKYRNESLSLRRAGLALAIVTKLNPLLGLVSPQTRQKLMSEFRSLSSLTINISKLLNDIGFAAFAPPETIQKLQQLGEFIDKQLQDVMNKINQQKMPDPTSLEMLFMQMLNLEQLLQSLGFPELKIFDDDEYSELETLFNIFKQQTGQQPSQRQPSGKQPSGRQPTGRQPTGEQPSGKQSARDIVGL